MKILANDGISQSGLDALTKDGFEVMDVKVAQAQLINYINTNNIVVLLVRSATKVGKDVIDSCKSLKIIGRGGVGMDNIEVEYARSKGIHVINTPNASSSSVAELVFGHLLNGARYMHDANRNMPLDGDSRFKALKSSYAKGAELRGKTLGIIGLGRIGIETAKIALGLGMKVIACDTAVAKETVTIEFFDGQSIAFEITTEPLESVLKNSDFITLHVPGQSEPVIGKKEIALMKQGAGIINASRGGIIDEVALIAALDARKLSFAGLDVYENEPTPAIKVLMNPYVSLTPHVGASTDEAQERIGLELASQITSILKG
jgi:D-3-phosphoglycerate dehydrogenase